MITQKNYGSLIKEEFHQSLIKLGHLESLVGNETVLLKEVTYAHMNAMGASANPFVSVSVGKKPAGKLLVGIYTETVTTFAGPESVDGLHVEFGNDARVRNAGTKMYIPITEQFSEPTSGLPRHQEYGEVDIYLFFRMSDAFTALMTEGKIKVYGVFRDFPTL